MRSIVKADLRCLEQGVGGQVSTVAVEERHPLRSPQCIPSHAIPTYLNANVGSPRWCGPERRLPFLASCIESHWRHHYNHSPRRRS